MNLVLIKEMRMIQPCGWVVKEHTHHVILIPMGIIWSLKYTECINQNVLIKEIIKDLLFACFFYVLVSGG